MPFKFYPEMSSSKLTVKCRLQNRLQNAIVRIYRKMQFSKYTVKLHIFEIFRVEDVFCWSASLGGAPLRFGRRSACMRCAAALSDNVPSSNLEYADEEQYAHSRTTR